MEATATLPSVIREQDWLIPLANVVRVMRWGLPPHAMVTDEAKQLIQECVSEFISFVTGEANERCRGEHRKTVTAEDIMWAMEHLGFHGYVTPLEAFVQRMRNCNVRIVGRSR
jgi:nuclear transcription Y subunit beta